MTGADAPFSSRAGRPEPRRAFGSTSLKFAPVGLGTWQIGTGWGRVDDAQALGVLEAARQAGVEFLDTADVYGDGRSETLIGRFMRENGWRPFVATKVGRWRDPGWPGNFKRRAVRAQVEASLGRLGLERLGLAQLHTVPDVVLRAGEMLGWLAELKAEGKIGLIGASVETVDQAASCLDVQGLDAIQVIFNVLRQRPAEWLLAKARGAGVAVIARCPLASGLLAGKIKANTTFERSDHRNFNRDGAHFNPGETFAGLPQAEGVELVRGLRELRPKGATMAQFALRYVLDHPEVSVVIPGARNAGQVEQNAAAAGLARLDDDCHGRLRDYYRSRVAPLVRGPM